MTKIRGGFVSNSSSSSFIIKLPQKIEEISLEDFEKMFDIKKDRTWVDSFSKDIRYNTKDCIKKLYSDLINTEKSKPNRIDETWFYEELNRDLDETEYTVEYSDNENFLEYVMEESFMPQVEMVTRVISWH